VRSGKDISGLSPEAMNLFTTYHWPGNVRELKSALEYAFVIAERGPIEPDHLPATLGARAESCVSPAFSTGEEKASREQVIAALRQSQGNITQAAKLLGVSRVTVWHRMKRYGIDLKRVVEN
jgi:two-component system, NtrC family, response regulator HydG